jgi:hypothetical protein
MSTTAASTLEEAAQGFEYLSEYKVLVCKEHGFGLRNLKRHLLEQHAYPKNVRDAIIERFGQLNVVKAGGRRRAGSNTCRAATSAISHTRHACRQKTSRC